MKKNKKNLILENIKLLSAGAKGVSIGKTEDGKTIIVSGAIPGDIVNARVKKAKSKYYEADAVEILTPSPFRVEPECKHFGVCGGGIEDFESIPILGGDEPYYYRNKMEFSFSNARWLTSEEIKSDTDINQKNALGFHIPGQWSKILDLKNCYLQEYPSNEIRLAIRNYAIENKLDFFDLKSQDGFLRTLMLRQNSKGEWMILIQFFKENEEQRIKLLNFILEQFPQITTLLYAINPKGNDSVYDLDIKTYFGEGFIFEEMDGLKFKIGPKSFFQTNYKQALNLYRKTLEFADINENQVVYDLYTGTGTIAQYIARHTKQVIGIEAVPEAIDAAKENAKLNGLDNCIFYCGDMKEVFTEEFLAQHPKADVLITDPPRDGMHPKVVEQILKLSPNRIVYVSCNSATQARDLALMKDFYRVEKILPVDMFPQTHHVENIALLTKK